MNPDALQKKLIAAARNNPPSDKVPYAFEKRIMARLAASHAADPLAFWSRALWRAAATCLAVMVLCSAWTMLSTSTTDTGADDDFELALFAGVNQSTE